MQYALKRKSGAGKKKCCGKRKGKGVVLAGKGIHRKLGKGIVDALKDVLSKSGTAEYAGQLVKNGLSKVL